MIIDECLLSIITGTLENLAVDSESLRVCKADMTGGLQKAK